MKRKFVVSDPEKCTGCRLCEMVCSAEKDGEFNPLLSRIRTVQLDVVVNMSLACRLCENPTCVRSCPRKALSVDEKTGVVLVDDGKCSGCGWCIEACELGVLLLHPVKKVVVLCDLCGGEPKCVEFCPKDALELRTTEEIAQKIRSEAVRKLLVEEL